MNYKILLIFLLSIFLIGCEQVAMKPDKIETKIEKKYSNSGFALIFDENIKKIKLVITMYLGGNPNNVIEFHKLKKKYNFFLIEDSCHALGSEYKNKGKYVKIGSCVHSDISTFSLHPVKSITSGEGGFLTTNSKINFV